MHGDSSPYTSWKITFRPKYYCKISISFLITLSGFLQTHAYNQLENYVVHTSYIIYIY